MTGWRRALLFLLPLGTALGGPLIDFPTDNHALAQGHPQDFFMYVNRDFEGVKSKPWQGGQYGFVRDPRRVGNAVVYKQIHEGIDIAPTKRDAQGNPLDEVRAAADGRVAYVNNTPGASNYGRYIVIEHTWDNSPCYTLYAHLSSAVVVPGQTVRQGEKIGQMGFTGAGIDRERAHMHFEICLMNNRNFAAWQAAKFPQEPNRHGDFNGLNLTGMDGARLLLQAQATPDLDFATYVKGLDPSFKLAIPNSPNFDLIKMYPWLLSNRRTVEPPAWAITFTRHGVPVGVEPLTSPVAEPTVLWVRETGEPYAQLTKNMVTGPKGSPRLTDSGRQFLELLVWPG